MPDRVVVPINKEEALTEIARLRALLSRPLEPIAEASVLDRIATIEEYIRTVPG